MAHLGLSDVGSESIVGNGNCGDAGKKRQREDDAGSVGSKKAGGHFFYYWGGDLVEEDERGNTRQALMNYDLDGEG